MKDYDPDNTSVVLGEKEYKGFVVGEEIKATNLYHGTLAFKSGIEVEFTVDKNNYDKMMKQIKGDI